jgi:hypothetical protein
VNTPMHNVMVCRKCGTAMVGTGTALTCPTCSPFPVNGVQAENAALRVYCAALERTLEQARRVLDARGRAVRKARKTLAEKINGPLSPDA